MSRASVSLHRDSQKFCQSLLRLKFFEYEIFVLESFSNSLLLDRKTEECRKSRELSRDFKRTFSVNEKGSSGFAKLNLIGTSFERGNVPISFKRLNNVNKLGCIGNSGKKCTQQFTHESKQIDAASRDDSMLERNRNLPQSVFLKCVEMYGE